MNDKSIDSYLEQNLRKEEILAAKMTKFLSVSKIISVFGIFNSFRFLNIYINITKNLNKKKI